MSEVIRFNQAVMLVNEADKISHYQEKINIIVREFSKNTMLQFMRFDIFSRLIDLGEVMSSGDISNFLFTELDKVFAEFEELQNDERFKDISKIMQVTITKYNERLREEELKENQTK